MTANELTEERLPVSEPMVVVFPERPPVTPACPTCGTHDWHYTAAVAASENRSLWADGTIEFDTIAEDTTDSGPWSCVNDHAAGDLHEQLEELFNEGQVR